MNALSRRDALIGAGIGAGVGLATLATPAWAQTMAGDEVDRIVTGFMQAFQVPGIAVTIVRPGQPVLARGYGVRELGRPGRVDADTQFAIASNSKAFLAAGIAMLIEEGKLGWDVPVVRYMPDFATSDADVTRLMTVRDLLCHRSGLPLGAGDLMQFPVSDHSRADIVHGLKYLPFERGFRTGYAYDNILYVVAGVLVERISGLSFEEFMTRRLLRPLGMRMDMAKVMANPASLKGTNVAARHARLGPPARGIGAVQVVEPDEGTAGSPAGGILSSATEIAVWLRTQMAHGVTPDGRRLWSDANAAEMWTPQVITNTGTGPSPDDPGRSVLQAYALGWFVGDYRGHRLISHSGGLSGQITQTAMLPEQGIGVAVFTNIEDRLSAQLRSALLDVALGVPTFDWLAATRRIRAKNEAELRAAAGTGDFTVPPGGPSLPLTAYAGRYRDPWYGDVVVRATGDKLAIDFTRTPVFKSVLEPFGPDSWRTRFAPGAGEDAVVAFVIEDGKPTRLKLRALSPLADFSYDFQHLTPVRVS
ncbi:serine hydrolase [Sphingomonas sp.]|uniref:serine hydrolase n=1 Tax=Sphingomonas sp. TaxID=28214 RepID=UPI003B0017A6